MWQRQFEKYKDKGFTVVGLALDVEGAAPAKIYYERFGVKFPALVDPNYATGFGAVPKTFFIDEHGVVQKLRGWEKRLQSAGRPRPVTDKIRAQWTDPGARLKPAAIARLVRKYQADPADLVTAVELASRYLALKLNAEARAVLAKSLKRYDPKQVAKSADRARSRLLGQAYLQLARACEGDRKAQVGHATMSFYLNPSVGFGKQIARVIAPEKFDHRPRGDFDNRFREGTLTRLRKERQEWLKSK